MNLTPIKKDDIVMADVRGDRFYAIVTGPAVEDNMLRKRLLPIASMMRRPIPAQRVSAVQVIGHWRKSAQSRT